jgi:hypothetical protein
MVIAGVKMFIAGNPSAVQSTYQSVSFWVYHFYLLLLAIFCFNWLIIEGGVCGDFAYKNRNEGFGG